MHGFAARRAVLRGGSWPPVSDKPPPTMCDSPTTPSTLSGLGGWVPSRQRRRRLRAQCGGRGKLAGRVAVERSLFIKAILLRLGPSPQRYFAPADQKSWIINALSTLDEQPLGGAEKAEPRVTIDLLVDRGPSEPSSESTSETCCLRGNRCRSSSRGTSHEQCSRRQETRPQATAPARYSRACSSVTTMGLIHSLRIFAAPSEYRTTGAPFLL